MIAASQLVTAFALQPQFQCFSGSTLALLEGRKLLQLTDNGKWHFGDDNNGGSRSFTKPGFKRCDTKGPDWHKVSGLQDVIVNNRKQVAFILEGVKDALAAAELFNRLGLLPSTGIVSALGAKYRPIESEIASLHGRKVVLIGDADPPGRECIARVSAALVRHEVDHIVLVWHEAAKDVFELLSLCVSQKTNFAPAFFSLTQFFSSPPLPLPGSRVQGFKGSTGQQVNSSSQEIAEFVAPFVVTQASTGNTFSFNLARALVTRDGAALSDETIRAAVHEWFVRSQPMLPADATEAKTLRKFYDQLRRVRFTTVTLDAACERARTSSLPEIPGLSANDLRAAALHRELQREAGDGGYICPISVVAKFLQLEWVEQARWIQHKLEKAGVIQCIERGAPHTEGKRGKSSVWRYLQPLPSSLLQQFITRL